MMMRTALVSALTTLLLLIATGTPAHAEANCKNLPSDAQLKALLIAAQAGSPNSPGGAGGIFDGKKMWGARPRPTPRTPSAWTSLRCQPLGSTPSSSPAIRCSA